MNLKFEAEPWDHYITYGAKAPAVFVGNEIGFVIHKWKETESPKGDFLAIGIVGSKIDSKEELLNNYQKILSEFPSIEDIENGIVKDYIKYFKYHSRQWRPIKKNKTKWAYLDKLEKDKKSNVQRLLK